MWSNSLELSNSARPILTVKNIYVDALYTFIKLFSKSNQASSIKIICKFENSVKFCLGMEKVLEIVKSKEKNRIQIQDELDFLSISCNRFMIYSCTLGKLSKRTLIKKMSKIFLEIKNIYKTLWTIVSIVLDMFFLQAFHI